MVLLVRLVLVVWWVDIFIVVGRWVKKGVNYFDVCFVD